jgi:hypothetical protein
LIAAITTISKTRQQAATKKKTNCQGSWSSSSSSGSGSRYGSRSLGVSPTSHLFRRVISSRMPPTMISRSADPRPSLVSDPVTAREAEAGDGVVRTGTGVAGVMVWIAGVVEVVTQVGHTVVGVTGAVVGVVDPVGVEVVAPPPGAVVEEVEDTGTENCVVGIEDDVVDSGTVVDSGGTENWVVGIEDVVVGWWCFIVVGTVG